MQLPDPRAVVLQHVFFVPVWIPLRVQPHHQAAPQSSKLAHLYFGDAGLFSLDNRSSQEYSVFPQKGDDKPFSLRPASSLSHHDHAPTRAPTGEETTTTDARQTRWALKQLL